MPRKSAHCRPLMSCVIGAGSGGPITWGNGGDDVVLWINSGWDLSTPALGVRAVVWCCGSVLIPR